MPGSFLPVDFAGHVQLPWSSPRRRGLGQKAFASALPWTVDVRSWNIFRLRGGIFSRCRVVGLFSIMQIQETSDGTSFMVRIHPRAKKNAIAGELGNGLKVSVTAPPVDGQANRACIEFSANLLKVARSSVTIASGQTNRNKIVHVAGISAEEVRRRLSI